MTPKDKNQSGNNAPKAVCYLSDVRTAWGDYDYCISKIDKLPWVRGCHWRVYREYIFQLLGPPCTWRTKQNGRMSYR